MKILKDEKGAALVATLLFMVVGVILVTGMIIMSTSESKQSIYQTKNMKAYYIARAGADAMVHRLLTIDKEYWDDFNTPHTTETTTFGDGSFKVNVKRIDDDFKVVSTGTYQNVEQEVKAVLKYNPNTKMQYVMYSKEAMEDEQLGYLNDDIGSGKTIGFKNSSYEEQFRPYANENIVFNPEINEINFSGVESSLIEADPTSLLTEVSTKFSSSIDFKNLTWTINTDGANFKKQENTSTHEVKMVAGDEWMIVWLKQPSVIENLNITGTKNLMIVVEDKLEIKGIVNLSDSVKVEIHVIDDSDPDPDGFINPDESINREDFYDSFDPDDYDLIISSPHANVGTIPIDEDAEKFIIYLWDNTQMDFEVNGKYYGYVIGPEAYVHMKNPQTELYGSIYCNILDIAANVQIHSLVPSDPDVYRLESIQFAYWE